MVPQLNTVKMATLPRNHLSVACIATTTTRPATSRQFGVWVLLPLLFLAFMLQQQPCDGRYLPTRSHGDDLEKLRELMLQILDSSNEEQRPPNEANGNTLAQRVSWLGKLAALDAAETPRKYNSIGGRGSYESGRYY